MIRRKLVVLGGLLVIAALALRRRKRRDAVDIEIDEPEARSEATADEGSTVELEAVEGIGPAYAERLREAGVANGADLATADVDDLAEETGIGERRIRGWVERISDEVAS